jgi:ABC-type glutathione transport system ATPase component
VVIARALASNATLLVAGEPTSTLDVSVQAQIINLILELTAARTRGLAIVSHDLAVIRHLTDEIVVLYQGRIVEQGRTLDVLDSPHHEHTRQLITASD